MDDFTKIICLSDRFLIEEFKREESNILIRHLQGSENEDDIFKVHSIFTANPNFLNSKLLLSMHSIQERIKHNVCLLFK